MYIVDPTLESDPEVPNESKQETTMDSVPLSIIVGAEASEPLVVKPTFDNPTDGELVDQEDFKTVVSDDQPQTIDPLDLDLQESFSRFRSRSEGSSLCRPKKSLLKKNSVPDTSSKLRRRVSFADSNGFQLEQIRSYDSQPCGSLEVDDDDQDRQDFLLPSVSPASSNELAGGPPRGLRPSGERRFVPYFSLPWNSSGGIRSLVYAALEDRKVCLEGFTVHSSWRISGTVLVKNLSFHKRVFVRRTLDKWKTYKDIEGTYVCSVNENVDRFHFELHFAFKLPPGTRLEVAIGYETTGQGRTSQHWDNNCDNNYAFWFNDKF